LDHSRQQEESDASVATVNAFLTVGFFALLGQAGDELKGEFIVATTMSGRIRPIHRWFKKAAPSASLISAG
jgi:hypothetical protein